MSSLSEKFRKMKTIYIPVNYWNQRLSDINRPIIALNYNNEEVLVAYSVEKENAVKKIEKWWRPRIKYRRKEQRRYLYPHLYKDLENIIISYL